MLRDRRDLVVTFADKAAVRDYVAEVVGQQYLTRAYAIVDDPTALLDVNLPESYVVKPTHGSGAAIVVSESAPLGSRLPSEPESWVYRHVAAERAHQLPRRRRQPLLRRGHDRLRHRRLRVLLFRSTTVIA
jgi:hypothetical protein